MNWTDAIGSAVGYIEEHAADDIKVSDIAEHVHISPYYFQKGFAMLSGYTLSEYLRNRRLALAAGELATGEKVIDVALKYGYDSPDSFKKAFSRFHNASPSAVQKGTAKIKTFAPLKINISLEGGCIMEYKILKKESFKVLGREKEFDYETCKKEIPEFWKEHYESGCGKTVRGEFGVNNDAEMGGKSFKYLIADSYCDGDPVPSGYKVVTVPEFTWAVFSCDGPMPDALGDVNKKIFSEWLPALSEYEFAAGWCIESYSDPGKYLKGTLDENYHSEIWIPVKRK